MELLDKEKLLSTIQIALKSSDMPDDWFKGAKFVVGMIKNTSKEKNAKIERTGKWSLTSDGVAHCSACDKKMNPSCYGYNHCSLCGAKMS